MHVREMAGGDLSNLCRVLPSKLLGVCREEGGSLNISLDTSPSDPHHWCMVEHSSH